MNTSCSVPKTWRTLECSPGPAPKVYAESSHFSLPPLLRALAKMPTAIWRIMLPFPSSPLASFPPALHRFSTQQQSVGLLIPLCSNMQYNGLKPMSIFKSHEFVMLVNNNNHTKVTPYLEVLVNARKSNHFHESETLKKSNVKGSSSKGREWTHGLQEELE